jgi:hypothetical protein
MASAHFDHKKKPAEIALTLNAQLVHLIIAN